MDSSLLLPVHLAATWFMTGLIWFVQIVHYPLMQRVGRDAFVVYSQEHQAKTSLVVGPPMLIEVLTAALLWARESEFRSSVPFLTSCGLLVVIWLSTALRQMPLHRQLLDGYDEVRARALVRSNWIRTVAWTARALLVTWPLWQHSNSN